MKAVVLIAGILMLTMTSTHWYRLDTLNDRHDSSIQTLIDLQDFLVADAQKHISFQNHKKARFQHLFMVPRVYTKRYNALVSNYLLSHHFLAKYQRKKTDCPLQFTIPVTDLCADMFSTTMLVKKYALHQLSKHSNNVHKISVALTRLLE
jgi:hypothetical protein